MADAAELGPRRLHLGLGGALEGGELVDVVEEGVELDVGELGPGQAGLDPGALLLEGVDLGGRLRDPLGRSVGGEPVIHGGEAGLREVGVARGLILLDGALRGVPHPDRLDELVEAGDGAGQLGAAVGHAGVAGPRGRHLGELAVEPRGEVGR